MHAPLKSKSKQLRAGVYGSASEMWINSVLRALASDNVVAPRGRPTRELPQFTVRVAMTRPLVSVPERKLSTKFACAEALWMLDGDDRVEPLAKFAPAMRDFSDDGVTLAGAYGPEIKRQLDYVVNTLGRDRDTRQAVLTMWKPNPPPSKDIPCTIALDFKIREGKLNCHAFMRSSDIWLGLPYDVFSFSMVAAHVACRANVIIRLKGGDPIGLGSLFLTAASSHLYEDNVPAAEACVTSDDVSSGPCVPVGHVVLGHWHEIASTLAEARDGVRQLSGSWD